MFKCISLLLVLVAGCGGDRIVYLYPDGAMPTDDGGVSDAGAPTDDAAPDEDAGDVDAWRPPAGTCEPDRTLGAVGHTDCRPYPSTPVCDAISEVCSPLPEDFCGACRTDDDCGNFDLAARCVFIPGDAEFNNDSACLSPCESDADCDFLRGVSPEWAVVGCFALDGGSFCAPDHAGVPHCRDGSGDRI